MCVRMVSCVCLCCLPDRMLHVSCGHLGVSLNYFRLEFQ